MKPRIVLALLLMACSFTPRAAAQELVQDFVNPTIRDFRLDFCRNFGTNCGQPAADLFCAELGFERSTFWLPAGPVTERTLIFGDGRLCDGPGCLAFALIQCAIVAPAPPPPPEPPPPEPPIVAEPPPPQPVVPAAPVPLPPERPEPPLVAAPLPVAPVDGAVMLDLPFTIIGYSPLTTTIDRLIFLDQMAAYPEGASLFACSGGDCSIAHTADREVDPASDFTTVGFNWNVSRVPMAGGVLIQASHQPFPAFENVSENDLDPPGLVFSGRSDGVRGAFDLDLGVLAEALPEGMSGALFHVRVFPVSRVATGAVVGAPSNVMRVYFGLPLLEQEPFQFFEPEIVAEAPPVELVALEFRPHRFIDWPAGCISWEAYRRQQQRTFFEKVADAFESVWDFAAEGYQWAKDRVLDLASAFTLGVIPDDVLSVALDVALASAGIPPDIPNLGELIDGGLDQLAAEMGKAAIAQIPTADLAVSLSNMAADITVELALAMAEDELRDRLQAEIEAKSREALVLAADELEAAAATERRNELCSSRFIPAAYRVTVVNTGSDPLQDVRVIVSDSEQVYWGAAVLVDLAPGQVLSFMTVPDPMIRDVWDYRLVRMEPMATNENTSHWWNEILLKQPTSIRVTVPGHRECLGACIDTTREVLAAPPQLLTEPFAWR